MGECGKLVGAAAAGDGEGDDPAAVRGVVHVDGFGAFGVCDGGLYSVEGAFVYLDGIFAQVFV